MAGKGIGWGSPIEDFPSGQFDDFDGKIHLMYEAGDYGTQVHAYFEPADYEYNARNIEVPDEDDDLDDRRYPQGWYGMGGEEDTYQISDDEMDVEGPLPGKNSRATKLIISMRESGKLRLGASLSLKPLDGQELHWKSKKETSRNPETGEKTDRDILYASGKSVGNALYGSKKKASSSKRGRSRDDEGDEDGDDNGEEKESPRESRRGSSRSSKSSGRSSKSSSKRSRDVDDSDASASEDDAFDAIVSIVEEAGDEGLARNKVATTLVAVEDELGADVIALASKRSTIGKAIDEGVIVLKDRKLYLPDEGDGDGDDDDDEKRDDD